MKSSFGAARMLACNFFGTSLEQHIDSAKARSSPIENNSLPTPQPTLLQTSANGAASPSKGVHFDTSLEQICFFEARSCPSAIQKHNILIVEDDFTIQMGSITKSKKARFQYNTHFGTLEIIDITIKYSNLYILVWVPNHSYEKTLFARITQDGWKSNENIHAQYLYSNDYKTKDCFQIALPILESTKKIEYCLYFESGQVRIWEKDLFDKNFVIYIQQYIDPNLVKKTKKNHKKSLLNSMQALKNISRIKINHITKELLQESNDQKEILKRGMESYFPLCY
jgi:hypothetical protein